MKLFRKDTMIHQPAVLAAVLLGSLLAASTALATTLSAEQEKVLAAGDAGAADPKKCTKCHNDSGVSDDDEVPHLAGQSARYLFKQLIDFAADARDGGRMNKTARKLSEQDMANLAALYGTKTLPPMADQPVPDAPPLVKSGDPARKLDSCASCHGEDGRGKSDKYDAPALAGMPYDYFVATMKAFAEGGRRNDADEVMRDAAKAMTNTEISSAAEYYLALGKRQRQPAP